MISGVEFSDPSINITVSAHPNKCAPHFPSPIWIIPPNNTPPATLSLVPCI